jgi:hypothetical protein
MNPEEFQRQLDRFCGLLEAEVSNDPSGLSTLSGRQASAFAEGLQSCASDDQAASRIRSDLAGARSFLFMAGKLRPVSGRRADIPQPAQPESPAPFSLLASAVLQQCKSAKGGVFEG